MGGFTVICWSIAAVLGVMALTLGLQWFPMQPPSKAIVMTILGGGAVLSVVVGIHSLHQAAASKLPTLTKSPSTDSTDMTRPPSTGDRSSTNKASPAATLTWRPDFNDSTAGATASFTFEADSDDDSVTGHLQRLYGSQGVWRDVSAVAIDSGSGVTPKLTLGSNTFRLVLESDGGHLEAVTKQASVRAFDSVPLEQLMHSGEAMTQTIGESVFRYAFAPNIDFFGYVENGKDHPFWRVDSSTCRSLDLRFGISSNEAEGNDEYQLPDTFKILSEDRDAQSITVGPGHIGKLHAAITPGRGYSVTMSGSYYAYVSGVGSCDAVPVDADTGF